MAKKPEQVAPSTPIYVGVDDGFANTDIVVLQGGRITTKLAIASRARSGIQGTSVIGETDGAISPCYQTGGTQFTVGEMPDAESARFDDYPFSNMNRAIVAHAGGTRTLAETFTDAEVRDSFAWSAAQAAA